MQVASDQLYRSAMRSLFFLRELAIFGHAVLYCIMMLNNCETQPIAACKHFKIVQVQVFGIVLVKKLTLDSRCRETKPTIKNQSINVFRCEIVNFR